MAKPQRFYDDEGLEESCGGTGTLNCFCGGDLCVCDYNGETECFGCEDCQDRDDCDEDEEEDQW